MSELRENPPHVEQLLGSGEVVVDDIEERPTISIENGLEIVRAFDTDIPTGSRLYALLERWMLPTPDLREKMIAGPISGGLGKLAVEEFRGKESVCWLGREVMDELVAAEGLPDFGAWLRQHLTPESSDDKHSLVRRYHRIYDGVGVISDLEGRGPEIPTWRSVVEKYGVEDPVIQDYFSRLKESVRVDAATLFGCLTSEIRISTTILPTDKHGVRNRVAASLDSFLLDTGYIPDQSNTLVV